MIIDPQSFVPLEIDRRLASTRTVRPADDLPTGQRRRRRRGPVLRLAAWATGRTALI